MEITSQGELEIMIQCDKPQHPSRSRRHCRAKQKRNRSRDCQKHEQEQTSEPQSQQQAQDIQRSEKQPQDADQPSGNQPQPQQHRFGTQQQIPHRYASSVEGPKQRDFGEAARQRTQYRERLQRIVSNIDSVQNKPKMSKYIPVQYQRHGSNRPQNKDCRQQKHQTPAKQSPEGRSLPQERDRQQLPRDRLQPLQPQSKPQSRRQSRQKQHKQLVEKRFGEVVRGLSQQRFRSQQLMSVSQGRSNSGQPLQQFSHAHPEPQWPQYIWKSSVKPQPPSRPQVQSLKETVFHKDTILPKSVQNRYSLADSQTLEVLFRPAEQKSSQGHSYPQKFAEYAGQPPSEPDTDYEQLNFGSSRSPSTVSLSSDGDEGIVIIGKWNATEGDGFFW